MSILFIVIPLAIAMASLALIGFIIAVKRGQFDDLETPPIRAIFDDDR